jgi:hypothetical protein
VNRRFLRENASVGGDSGAVAVLLHLRTADRFKINLNSSAHFEKRDCAIAGTAQNRSRVKRAPIFLPKTLSASDPVLLAEDALPHESCSRRGAEAVHSAPARAAFGSRPAFLAKPQNPGREMRIGRV